jgi:rhodanese-related sulfurtransferase
MIAMKKYFLFLLLIACGDKKTDSVLAPQDFDAKYKATANAILLDVRTPEEIAGGKIANSENIVWDDSFVDKLSNLEHKPIFVYCASGIRSAKAAAVLKEKGYNNVYELDGGMKAWKAAGMPVE